MRSARMLVSVFGVALVVAGCSDLANDDGSVAVQLVAMGPDGATYRLPTPALFTVQGGGLNASKLLDGNQQAVSFRLPPGSYDGRPRDFSSGADPAGLNWNLTRTDADGTISVVQAQLQTPLISFVVVAGSVTPVVIKFNIPKVGDVVFVTGQVEIRTTVGQETVPAASIVVQFTGATGAQVLNGSAALNAREMAAADTPFSATMVFTNLNWQHAGSRVCADSPIVSIAVDTPHAGLAELAGEVGTGGFLCFDENGILQAAAARVGLPVDPDLVPLITSPQQFELSFTGVGTPIWDGETLGLSTLSTPQMYAPATTPAGRLIAFNPTAGGASILINTGLNGTLLVSAQP